MAALTLRFALLLASLIHHTGADCLYSGPIGPCSSCFGACYRENGCSCSNGVTSCLPDGNVPCTDADPALCCPPGLYYNQTSSCCTETPICYGGCATDEVCDMGVCVCNSSIYHDKNVTDFHPALSCDINTMTVTVSQCLLSSLGYDPPSIHLRNSSQSCNFLYDNIANGQKFLNLQVVTTSGVCGNTATEDGSRLFITNTVDIDVQVNSSVTPNPISFNVTCPLFTGTNPLARTVVISGVRLNPLTMAAYKDPQFGTPYASNEIVLGSEIYVALYVYPTDGDTYVLRLEDCAASPTADRNDTKALHLISQGCANDSLTQIIQNGNSREVRMKIRSSQFQDFTTVYLFCDARLCVKSAEECTACKSQSFSMGVTQLQLDLRLKDPNQPENITFVATGATNVTLSWKESTNLTAYEVVYWNSSSTLNVTSNSNIVTLQDLTSGTEYTIAVVPADAGGSGSDTLIGSVITKPMPVKNLWQNLSSAESIVLYWSRPDEYQSSYTYRVQTNVTSPSTWIRDTIVTNESATIVNLTPGEMYTFLIYTRASDNVTESDPVSLTTCTVAGLAALIAVNSNKSVDSLVVNWTISSGKASYYNVTITGDVNHTIQTGDTQVTFIGLSPGREYNVTVQTVSGNCSDTSPPVTEATYPTPPQTLNFNTIGSDGITVSWKDPANMSGLAKSYNITWNPSSNTGTVASYVPNVTLQNLTSATNYTITVLTVGARGYQSTPVTGWRVTSPLEQPGSVQVVRSTSGDSMNVTFQGFDTKNGPIVAYAIIVTTDLNGSKPPEGVLKKTNNDFKNGLTKTYVTSVIEQNSQRSTRSNEISAHVGDGSQSRGYVNAPLDPKLQYRVGVAGFTQVNYSSTTNTINEDQSTAIITSYSGSPSATTTTTGATTNATSASTKPNNTNTSIASNSGSPSSNATTATTKKASNTGTRHVQCMICGLPLSHLQLMTYLLCAFYSFVHM